MVVLQGKTASAADCRHCPGRCRNSLALLLTAFGPSSPNTPGSASGITLTVDKDEDDLCAIFHTHTSFRYMPSNCYRATGPSGTDTISANSFNVPSLVYDYDGDIVWGQRTYSEHHVYTCGPYQRPPSR